MSTYPMVTSASTSPTDLAGTTIIDYEPVGGQNNLLFSALSGTDVVLYYAKGAAGIDDTAEEVIQVTDGSQGSVWNLTQVSDTSFRYWQNGVIHELTVGPNGDIASIEAVEEDRYPGNVDQDPSPSPDVVVGPGPGGGDLPEWWDNPKFHKPGHTVEESAELLGYEWFEVQVSMGETQPMFITDCNGQEIPVVGASIDSISASTVGGSVSVGLDLWFGMDPRDGCLYLGSDSGGFCWSYCGIDLVNATEAIIKDVIDAAIEAAIQSVSGQISPLEGLDDSDLVAAAVGVIVIAALALYAPAIIGVIAAILAAGTLSTAG